METLFDTLKKKCLFLLQAFCHLIMAHLMTVTVRKKHSLTLRKTRSHNSEDFSEVTNIVVSFRPQKFSESQGTEVRPWFQMPTHNDVETEIDEEDFKCTTVREQDRFLPIANISRIMKKALPANAKIAKDAKETVQECVSEFISFITSE